MPRFIRPYSSSLIPYKREFEAVFKVDSFNPSASEINIAEAEFNSAMFHMREDYWWIERGIHWRIPNLIPREQTTNFEDARSLIMEPSTMRYIDYSKTSKLMYSKEEKKEENRGYAKSIEDPGEGLYFRIIEKRLSLHRSEN